MNNRTDFSATMSVKGEPLSISGDVHGEAGRRASLSFVRPGDLATLNIKGFCAAAIQSVLIERSRIELPADPTSLEMLAHADAMRSAALAVTHLETACMHAVKMLHHDSLAGLGPAED